jgi:hypothetical protein
MEIDNKIHKQLDSNGIIILKNAITHDELNKLCTKYESGWKEIINKWNTLQWMKIKFNNSCQNNTGFIGKDLYDGKTFAKWQNTDEIILNMGNGRYDFTNGLENIKIESKIVNDIMKQMLEFEYDYYLGGLPIVNENNDSNDSNNSNDSNGRWHRDAYSLFDNEEIDMKLKPFYYTILIPLDNIDVESGRTTEFITQSHKLNLEELGINNIETLNSWCEKQNDSKIKLVCKAGDVCIFHGYTIHRGLGTNTTNNPRIIYAVYKKNWYNDEPKNNYL